MPEKVTVREDLQIIQVDSYGEVRIEDLRRSMETVIKLHRERGLTKVYIDASKLTSMPSTLPVFEFGSEMAELFRTSKFAVVRSKQTRDVTRFLENVVRNRGAHMEMFDSEGAALAWLTNESTD